MFGNVELKAMKTMEQPTLDQRNIKSTKTLTPIEIFPQIKGNELNKPFILFFFFLFFSFCCFIFYFFIFLLLLIFIFFSFFQVKTIRHNIVNWQLTPQLIYIHNPKREGNYSLNITNMPNQPKMFPTYPLVLCSEAP